MKAPIILLLSVLASAFSKGITEIKSTVIAKTRLEAASLIQADTNSILLADLTGKQLTFDDIKRKHSGKIIFVDFWASWCGPCREAMPGEAKLRQAMKNKSIVFVYLSIDSKPSAWKKASLEENLNGYDENYLILNHTTSEFLKKQNLSFIPRAMIFDKTGRLIYPNTGPGGMEYLPFLTKLSDKP